MLVGLVFVHVLGDLVMPEGVPVPVWWIRDRKARISVPLLDGGLLEHVLVAPALTLLLVGLVWTRFGYPDLTQVGELLASVLPRL